MTSKQAFDDLLSRKDYLLSLELDERNKIKSYQSLYKKGKMKLNNIDTLLERHGYILIQEKQWKYKLDSHEPRKNRRLIPKVSS